MHLSIRRCPSEFMNVTVWEHRTFDSSPNIIKMMETRRMRWAGHVERMGAKRNIHMI
jgi:hypothetical protein